MSESKPIKPPLSIMYRDALERGISINGWIKDATSDRYYEPTDYARWQAETKATPSSPDGEE